MNDLMETLTGWNYCKLCNKKLYFKKFMGKKYVLNKEYFGLFDGVYLMVCQRCCNVV